MTHNSDDTKDIRQRMEEVRCDLDKDVQGIVEGARDMRDWRSYVRTYPWVCAGAALAVGYLIVPRHRVTLQPDTETLAELLKQSGLAATPRVTPLRQAGGLLMRCVSNLVMQEVSSYVAQHASKLFAPPTANSMQDEQR